MWLLPLFPPRAAGRVFYRLTLPSHGVPASGPVLLVANHPNSLLDPILVVAAARRPVRFLRERWRGAWDDLRRFFLLRSRAGLVRALRERRRSLATKFRALYQGAEKGWTRWQAGWTEDAQDCRALGV